MACWFEGPFWPGGLGGLTGLWDFPKVSLAWWFRRPYWPGGVFRGFVGLGKEACLPGGFKGLANPVFEEALLAWGVKSGGLLDTPAPAESGNAADVCLAFR